MNKINKMNKNEVNGPVNILRLEGSIGKIKKIIYLFMDYHINVEHQTQCTSILAKDVQYFFAESFYELSKSDEKMYDFFLEIDPSEIYPNINNVKLYTQKDIYISEVVSLFKKMTVYEKDKMSVNKSFKKIRLHYLDIRSYLINNLQIKHDIVDSVHEMLENDVLTVPVAYDLINNFIDLRDNFKKVVSLLSKKNNTKKKTPIITQVYPDDDTSLEYLLNKMKEQYNHRDVKRVMNTLINQSKDKFAETIKSIDKLISKLENYATRIAEADNVLTKDNKTDYVYVYGLSIYTIREMIVELANEIEYIVDEKYVELFARFTDIFAMRRFLDKDYITNVIIYSGAAHSTMYVHTLVNSFGFKITHASYSKYDDFKRLNDAITKKSLPEMTELILPPVLRQCSDMKTFPKGFS